MLAKCRGCGDPAQADSELASYPECRASTDDRTAARCASDYVKFWQSLDNCVLPTRPHCRVVVISRGRFKVEADPWPLSDAMVTRHAVSAVL
jgi:hypothetical protein